METWVRDYSLTAAMASLAKHVPLSFGITTVSVCKIMKTELSSPRGIAWSGLPVVPRKITWFTLW